MTTEFGSVPWNRDQILAKLDEFNDLYQQRPVQDNRGGMEAPHMFAAWFMLQCLNPKAIIESGVWLGQGTWFFEKACPASELHCIDPHQDRILYRSPNAIYYNLDFSNNDWGALPKKETVLFFDDHQNAFERLKTAKGLGFSNLIFEDNYPASQGDCYSLKKVLMHSEVEEIRKPKSYRNRLASWLGSSKGAETGAANERYFRETADVYYEFPPLFKTEKTRWGDLWTDDRYPTPEPLLSFVNRERYKIFWDEAKSYTWICYVHLR